MNKMIQEINNLGEQVSKILELLSIEKGKVVVDTTQSSNPIQDTDDLIYPPGFTPYHMNVSQSQTTQHYVPTNSLYVVPPIVPGIKHLEAQAKIQDMGQNENTPAKQKLDVLEERLRAIEGTDVYGNIDITQLCLVPGLIIPAKFKVPKFDKYDGSTCPMSHLIMYCRKMAPHINNDKLLVHCFQNSLTGPASRWYIQLDNAHIHVWKDLADAFLKQYKHNIDMAPDRLDLQRMEKKSSESFKEYAQRWRDMVVEVQPPLTDKEMTSMFMNTLRAPFYERMIGNASTNFSDIIVIGERIEYGIKHGRLAEATTEYGGIKKGTISKMKEGEVHAIGFPNSSYVPTHTVSETPKPVNSNSPRPFVQGQGSKTNSDTWRFDPISMTYTELLPQLIRNRQLAPIPMIPIQPSYPKWYNSNARCDYHAGGVGHSTENCLALKRKVIIGSSVDNITGISGITRSGRCYKPDNLTVPSDGLILEQCRKNEKRNVKEHCKDQDVEMSIIAKDIEYKKLVTDEEANEFLKIVKQKPHRKALLDILNKAHVRHDILVETFSRIIGNITSSNSIVFTDDEIPPEGLGHTKALHIQVKCKDYVIARVLVDNGLALNIMPKSTLLKLPVDVTHKIKYYGCESFRWVT
ncbi:Gag-pro-like protein [Cucumis melo var. makuwa]|uniref:Gag-pro-like protein n=1 Tax=Cucumis melo var. makuwa TaxID=1194695 RepID=A0A5D3BVZ5_CUCMM|nr:Gag-pro-like protein [Cucumis melo var. makuwa]TYK03245.1 Gag-pro-like protein [Cucumis melo var. makuwa]